jgi:hypothetical protein
MLSQHIRSQALVNEGYDRPGESVLNLAILVKTKPEEIHWCNSLNNVPYQNPGTVLNRQGSGQCPLLARHIYDLLGHCFLSGVLH